MQANLRTKNARAVVTGAGSGIGRAFAMEIARRGGSVICSDINELTAERTAQFIRALGREATSVRCDVASAVEVQNLANTADSFFGGRVNLMVNNAGVGIGGRVGEITLDDWKWALGINLWGVIHGCHEFVPRLRKNGGGGIVNVASAAGFAAAPEMGPYNVTKSAVMSLSETLAAELAGSGINVSVLCPTFVQTNILEGARAPEGKMRLGRQMMRWTGISPDTVARNTLDALDAGKLYVVPQFDARLTWRIKRLLPSLYARGLGAIYRLSH